MAKGSREGRGAYSLVACTTKELAARYEWREAVAVPGTLTVIVSGVLRVRNFRFTD